MSSKITKTDAEIIFNYLFKIISERLQIGYCPKQKKYCAIVDKHDASLIGAMEMSKNHVRCLLKAEVKNDYKKGTAPKELNINFLNLFVEIFMEKLGEETVKKYENNPNNKDFIVIDDKGKL